MSDSGLQAVFLANRSLVERLIIARTRDKEEAEDILQELWLRVELARSGPISQPLAYIMRMALNLAADRAANSKRRRGREEAWGALQPGSVEFPDPEQSAISRAELDRVQRAIEAMPPNMGRALIMFRLEGQRQGEIARQLAMSVSGVEKLLARAYRKLAEAQPTDFPDMNEAKAGQPTRSNSDVG